MRVHNRTNPACPVGQRLPVALRARFEVAEAALLGDLASTSLADLIQSQDAGELERSGVAGAGHAPGMVHAAGAD